VAVGGVCAGEVTGRDERADGRCPSARGRAAQESGAVVADGWGRSVSGRGGEHDACGRMGRVGRERREGNMGSRGRERGELGLDPA
jgi:hypothetical protein